MMKNRPTYSRFAVNLLIAVVISIMVNFSYFVLILLGPSISQQQAAEPAKPEIRIEASAEKRGDGIAVKPSRIAIDSLQNDVVIREENIGNMRRFGNNPIMGSNGRLYMAVDTLFYFLISLILLAVITRNAVKERSRYSKRLLLCLAIFVAAYFLAPQITWSGELTTTVQSHRIFNPMLLLKLSAAFAVVALYGKVYELLYKNQSMALENEQLKNENLTSQYNVLVNQVNPHFLFNSLNSLSMLVREGKNSDALTYIDQMSDTYRYIIQDGTNNFTTVENELRFMEAYRYLLEIRYAGKLHIETRIPKEYYGYAIPPLSIQPLIENTVKHNSITSAHPMMITLAAEDGYLTVSNPIMPKIEGAEAGTGIGLGNLSSRYRLVAGRDIVIHNDGKTFTVKLPVSKQ